MAIKHSGEGEAIEAIRTNNNVIFHLFPNTLQGNGSPSYTRHVSQRRRGINGYGRAASASARGGKAISADAITGRGAAIELG